MSWGGSYWTSKSHRAHRHRVTSGRVGRRWARGWGGGRRGVRGIVPEPKFSLPRPANNSTRQNAPVCKIATTCVPQKTAAEIGERLRCPEISLVRPQVLTGQPPHNRSWPVSSGGVCETKLVTVPSRARHRSPGERRSGHSLYRHVHRGLTFYQLTRVLFTNLAKYRSRHARSLCRPTRSVNLHIHSTAFTSLSRSAVLNNPHGSKSNCITPPPPPHNTQIITKHGASSASSQFRS